MKWRDLPPLASLRAFGAFAETGTLQSAGDALGVSHAAISQQIRTLEDRLGLALVDRSGRALRLTEDGARLADALLHGFGAIADTVAALTGADAARPVHVSTTPTFAASWLMPRLSRFRALHPGIDLRIDPSPALVRLEPGGIDVALRYGDGDWPGLETEMLLQSPMVVVAAPILLEGRRIAQPSDLAALPWLEELGTTESTNWLRRKGVADGIVGSRIQVPGNLLLDGVRDGQGVTVTVRAFVARDLEAGRLLELFGENDSNGYHIVTRPGVLRRPARDFVTWLRREGRRDASKGAQRMPLS